MVLHASTQYSPNDISGFTTLSGDNAIAGVTLPFSVTIDGTSYSTVTIGTNGIIQFGTTTGANPAANAALPSGSFPNPTLFYYWDDLQTEGGNIQYGTFGASPNRTFIVDFQENLVASSGDKQGGRALHPIGEDALKPARDRHQMVATAACSTQPRRPSARSTCAQPSRAPRSRTTVPGFAWKCAVPPADGSKRTVASSCPSTTAHAGRSSVASRHPADDSTTTSATPATAAAERAPCASTGTKSATVSSTMIAT